MRLADLPFNKEDYSPLLYRLSAMYSFVRQHLNATSPSAEGKLRNLSMNETHPGKEEYISHKFWVHLDNLLEVKTMILRRLPVLVYNPQTSKIAEGNTPDPSITSIYFDNPGFSLYTNKVDHGEASSLRLRWYGQLNAKPEMWVEKKTVDFDQEEGQSRASDSRFTMKEKYVQRFLGGEYHMEKQIKKIEDRAGVGSDEAKSLKSSVDEIQDFIKENDLQPVLRANYTRTAFQIPGDDRVRISLDTDLAFIREDSIDTDRPCRDPETWHRTDIDNAQLEYPFSSIRKGEITRFPYAVLELKIRGESRKSEWIQDLMNSHLVKEAPRFSKFVHGVAQLFEDYVNTFPFWLSEMAKDIRKDPQQAFEEEQARKRKEAEDEVAVGSLIKSKSSMSPLVQAGRKSVAAESAVISPVGSPATKASELEQRSSQSQAQSPFTRKTSTMHAEPTQMDNVAEEPDEDEDGHHTHGTQQHQNYGTTSTTTTTTLQTGLKSLIPSFSTSKYAAHKRLTSHPKLPPGVEKPAYWIKDTGPIKVEAKVWLANQRTFIKWQHVSILLATLSLGLYNAAGSDNDVARALGVVYTVVAVFAGGWGYGVYMWRTGLIERRSGRDFDAVLGPCVVCLGLVVALGANFGFKYRGVVEERGKAGVLMGGGNGTAAGLFGMGTGEL